MRRKLGMALVMVLMVSMVLVAFILTGVQLTGRNLFAMARSHERNQALYAAEAGIYATVAEFETLDRFPDDGVLPKVTLSNGASYQVEVDREGEEITLRSTGIAFRAKRTLQAKLSLSADSYQAVYTEGRISVADDTFVNGVQSTLSPKPDKGNLHTNLGASGAIQPDTNGDVSASPRLSTTGLASARGSITATVIGKQQANAGSVDPMDVNRDQLLGTSTYTTITSIPSDNTIRGHVKFDGNLDFFRPLVIEEGAVLHVTGDCALGAGVTGSGTLVVDKECLVRASDHLDLSHPRGVFLYAGAGASIIHPEAVRTTIEVTTIPDPDNPEATLEESQEIFVYPVDELSHYFAEKPEDAEFNIRQGLPLEAPMDLEFFEYYEVQKLSPSEAFELWRNGDGTPENPGLRPEVKAWLDKSSENERVKHRIREEKAREEEDD
jgi:hypothetical protein